MPSQKFVGVETEFGIQVVGASVNPVLASSMVVGAYRRGAPREVRWDHTEEHPMRDARGHEEPDVHELPDDELGLANTVLTNGARFYVDHAHPEYSSPECADARQLVVWDRAGERILEDAARLAGQGLPDGARIVIHKNNTDGKGAAYGTHENYLLPRSVPFGLIVRTMVPYFVSRPIWAGAGRIGNEFGLDDVPFQCSQRADFFEVEVGLETTLKRPIVNTRDEPHADPDRYRRLHVINGDANLCEVATYLKVGVTMLVLDALEDGLLDDEPRLAQPVRAFHRASHDLTARVPLELEDGTTASPLELQEWYLQRVHQHAGQRDLSTTERDVLARWERVLATAWNDPAKLAGQVDWATKHDLLDRYATRHGLDWSSDRLAAVALQYHDVRRDRGLYHRLAARGEVDLLVGDDEVEAAITQPPPDSRAWFRGTVLERFGDDVVAAGWDSLTLDTGRDALQRIPMMEPGRGTRAHVEQLLASVSTAAELVDALRG